MTVKSGLGKNFKITGIHAREILDSRGNPTIEVEVHAGHGFGIASVPSGASKGKYEALELRDGDETRYNGEGVKTAVDNINKIIAPKLLGGDVRDQEEIDKIMIDLDSTENKSRLGANAILGVSLATAKAAANSQGISLYKYLSDDKANLLPVPMMNVINGGKHAGNELKIQEFMILPVGGETFAEALRIGVEVYHSLKKLLRESYGPSATNLGDEGGYAPPMRNTNEALEALIKAIEQAGYTAGKDLFLGMDAAASEFYNSKEDEYSLDNKSLDKGSLISFYEDLVKRYPLFSIEDPLHEEDFQGLAELTRILGKKVQIVGDDVFVTDVERLKKGIKLRAANALLLKVNQVGSLTEAIDAARLAMKNGYRVVVSHRSGETGDSYIADIAVALNAGQIKTGAPARGERVAKYNRLLKIETELGNKGTYAGKRIIFT
jgi:enolase